MTARREFLEAGAAMAATLLGTAAIAQDPLLRVETDADIDAILPTVAPWRFTGATSSPVNPLAIF